MKAMKKIYQALFMICGLLWFVTNPITAKAATGSVTFGSANYQWEEGSTNPIGIYVSGDETIASYEVELSYDPEMLRYVSGAAQASNGKITLKGTGNKEGYRETLNFEVLKAGSTRIRVESAVCETIEKTETISGGDARKFTEKFEMTLSAAPIATSDIVSSMLADLTIEPVGIKGFKAENLEYSLKVPYEVEELQVNYVLEDPKAKAALSDTKLKVGSNNITITIQGSTTTVYKITAVRAEESEATTATGEESTTPPSSEETVSTESQTTETGESVTDPSLEETVENPDATEPTEEVEQEKKDYGALIHSIILWAIFFAVIVMGIVYLVTETKKRLVEKPAPKKKRGKDVDLINLDDTVIKVKQVTMRFKTAKDESDSLKEYLLRWIKGKNEYSYFTALDNVSFEVKQGDVVGIIGTNGSGKSTILKVIAGAMKPTKGRVEVDQSKVQILTLGTGFDMELTARENVYLNGAIIGYTKEYIDEKYNEIVKFAELEGFMEERMKNFSSGMVSRLGFAIATMRDTPDILILDEVLSVGDMFFRQKSEKRIKEMIHCGATVLIVSHSMDTIRKNCNKVIWLEKGVLQMVGDPAIVCDAFTKKI